MLVATSVVRTRAAGVESTLVLERAVRGLVVRRENLAFDTKYLARAAGALEPAGHLFMLLAGRFVSDRGEMIPAPVAHLLADDEMERPTKASRTFRTDGERVDVVHLRIASQHLRPPIGMDAGPIALSPSCWDAAAALVQAAPQGDACVLTNLIDALARADIVGGEVTSTVIADEPERFRRLWGALSALFKEYGGTTSLKQLASSLGMSMRQVGRDAKELARAFGFGSGYRDVLLAIRLRQAVLLLSAPDAGVGDVAKLVGYASPIAMARAFRDAKLPSPSAIQAALRGE